MGLTDFVPCAPKQGHSGRWRVSTTGAWLDGEQVYRFKTPARSSVEDRHGQLWVATSGEKLLRFTPKAVRVVVRDVGDPRVLAIHLEDGMPWFAAPMEGWWREGGQTLTLGASSAVGYLVEHQGITLEAGPTGLLSAEGPIPVEGFAFASASTVDDEGTLWLASRVRGLFSGTGRQFTRRPLPDHPTAVVALPEGDIAVALVSGEVGVYDQVFESRVHVGVVRHIRPEGVRLWLSTEERGLCVVPDRTAATWTVRCLGRGEGLPARGAHVSVQDSYGHVWVSTNHGLAVGPVEVFERFADGELAHVPLLVLDERHGLATAEANGGNDNAMVLGPDGTLWVATQEGAVAVDTSAFSLPKTPVVRMDALDTALEPDHSPVSVGWAAPHLLYGDQVVFRTRFGDGDWSAPRTDRAVRFDHLAPGDTVFEVQAGLAGVWGPATAVTLHRRPTFAESPWALALAALLAGLATGGLAVVRQATLRRRAHALEALVAVRTAVVREQAAKLEGVDALRTRMIQNLHHELRTPLALVLGPLRERDDPALARARRNAERLGDLIEQLGDIAHLDAGTTGLAASRGSLSSFVQGCVDRFRELATARGVTLEVRAPEGVEAWFDPDLLDKALGNLVNNAVKFTPRGGRIQVDLVPGDLLTVRVADQAAPIPEAQREQVFERLVQLDAGDDRGHEGSGLGLAIAREVMELHGGAVACLPGDQGNVFQLTLPRGLAHLSPQDIRTSRKVGQQPQERVVAGAATLLVVEDRDDMRDYLCEVLGEVWSVVPARDGEEGWERLVKGGIDLVVSDVMMPRLSGLDLARRMRRDPRFVETPVVLVSAKSRAEDRAEGLEVADAWLPKPFYAPELRAHVAALVGAIEARPVDDRFRRRLEEVARSRLDDAGLDLAALAKGLAMSERSLQRRCTEVMGQSPSTWLRELRLSEAQSLLRAGAFDTVAEVAARVGMSRTYFSRAYRAWAGHPPTQDLRKA